MEDEIFGPVLPLVAYRPPGPRNSSFRPDSSSTHSTLGSIVNFVRDRPKPLALYVFTTDKETREFLLEKTSSGAAVVIT